jgi:UMF1 family MFS transporter
MNRKNIFLWTLYDFANSIVDIVFFLYFAQWLVVDRHVTDFWYNMIFVAASLLLLLSAPVLGAIADKNSKQRRYFNTITVLTFVFFLFASLTSLFSPGRVFWAVLFFMLASYFYQFSFVFYNSFLHDIAPKEKWGWVSGIGQAGNWLGQIVGLLVTLPFATGAIYLFGQIGRAQTFLPATILFFILALPMLLLFKPSRDASQQVPVAIKLSEEYKGQWNKFKDLIKEPNMKLFLLAYFFFNDAIITASDNFPIFLEHVFSVSDSTKSMLLVGILATSVIGALLSGHLTDKIGLKKSLLITIGSWVILFPLLGLVKSFSLFVIFAVLMGFLFGSIWTVSRAVMTALTPPEKSNYGFSFYTIAERASTFLGPIAWGLITTLFISHGPIRYRFAVTSMTVFVLIGFYLAQKINFQKVI